MPIFLTLSLNKVYQETIKNATTCTKTARTFFVRAAPFCFVNLGIIILSYAHLPILYGRNFFIRLEINFPIKIAAFQKSFHLSRRDLSGIGSGAGVANRQFRHRWGGV